VFLSLLTITGVSEISAQGCSDAGFCTIGSLKHISNTKQSKSTLTIGSNFGLGDEGVFVSTQAIQYDRTLSKVISIQGKLTSNYASGDLGNTVALGDLFLSSTFKISESKKWKPQATIGIKLPFNNSNIKKNGLALPMQYQSSLGTVDVILGASATISKWQIAAGFQIPITEQNGNQFLPVYWNNSAAINYPPSFKFQRKSDALLRVAYNIFSSNKLYITTGLLGIYHLSEDAYTNNALINKPITNLVGSDCLTLNFTSAVSYNINNKFSFNVTAGIPLVIRDIRPDGLTRSFVFAPEIAYRF